MQPKPETRQVRVHLPLDLHRRVRHLAVDEGVAIREMVVRLLERATRAAH